MRAGPRVPIPTTLFHCYYEPTMGIGSYITWLRSVLGCSVECYVVCLVYIERAVKRCPTLAVNALSCHRLLACGLTLAAKVQDDECYLDKHYAKVTGLDLGDLVKLQHVMLDVLDYRLVVQPIEFETYREVLAEAARSWSF
mmetsp:Transcript_64791/g.187790  ORF Transcript_64791/g.187790 Transcript_64791/m.187790 type:complete len:141 (+) Transcript_64791:1622-2044(+)